MQFLSAHPFQFDRRALAALVLAGLVIMLAGLLTLFVQGSPVPWESVAYGGEELYMPIRWALGGPSTA